MSSGNGTPLRGGLPRPLAEIRADAERWSDTSKSYEPRIVAALARDVLALADALEATTAERDEWRDRAKGAEHNEAMVLSDLRSAEAERDRLAAQVATLRARLSAHAEMEDCGQCRRAVREAGEALAGLVEQPQEEARSAETAETRGGEA